MTTSERQPNRETTVPCRTSLPSPCTLLESEGSLAALELCRKFNRDQNPEEEDEEEEDLEAKSPTEGSDFDSSDVTSLVA